MQDDMRRGGVIHSARTVGSDVGSPVPGAQRWPPHIFPTMPIREAYTLPRSIME